MIGKIKHIQFCLTYNLGNAKKDKQNKEQANFNKTKTKNEK